MFKAGLKTDFPKIPVSQNFHIRLLITMSAQLENSVKRPQLNLGLVLDHSGSMQGDKLKYVKMAASDLISRLAKDDIFSLTIFDDDVDVLIPPSKAGSAPEYKQLIEGICDRGATNLSGGYQKGFDLVSRNKTNDNVSRILLLTDGLANRGVTDLDPLSGIANSFKNSSVTTTTIGAGNDYDELLMGAIANSGGGNSYFIENPDDAPGVFQEELGYLLSLAATNVSVSFTPKIEGVKITQLNNYRRNDAGSFEIGDLYTGQEKILLLELELPAQKAAGAIDLAEVKIEYRDANVSGMPLETVTEVLCIEAVRPEEFKGVHEDHDVTRRAALLYIADVKYRMMTLSNEGKFDEAGKLGIQAAEKLEKLGLEDADIVQEIKELKERAKRIKGEGLGFYNAREKKRMYYESNMVMKSDMCMYSEMKSRRKD